MTVTYGPNGFSPANITVPTGTTVTWVNSTSGRMWVGVDEHPTHTNYDGTSTAEHCANGTATSASVFDQCSAGARYSFTFTKAGAFDYHNHANSSHGGTVTVTR
jgi:plastocyanin